jgi:hypothetical protein
MRQKQARILAAVAIAASAIGAAWAAAVFPPTPGRGNLVWYVAPVLLSAAVYFAVSRRNRLRFEAHSSNAIVKRSPVARVRVCEGNGTILAGA